MLALLCTACVLMSWLVVHSRDTNPYRSLLQATYIAKKNKPVSKERKERMPACCKGACCGGSKTFREGSHGANKVAVCHACWKAIPMTEEDEDALLTAIAEAAEATMG